ncbi:peptidase inhibitor family I36 protein [Streptomyces xiangluensis]|uniref:Peptidase inhibitor family I36 protein n=1 Tax=Streptomyces xiangluensis TaxID=2665720 RepID=A0ABV8YV50_9ACTN
MFRENRTDAKPRMFRRTLTALALSGAAAAFGLVAPSPASAAASCPSGSLCVWDGANYTGNRCSWSNADADWYGGSVSCSWADNRGIKSYYNHGTSTAYEGVRIYTGANYTGNYGCARQGQMESTTGGAVKFRSHKWVADC